jgi:hypothetical protein
MPVKPFRNFPIIGTNYFLVDISRSYSIGSTHKSWTKIPSVGQRAKVDGREYSVLIVNSDHAVLANLSSGDRIVITNLIGSCNARVETNKTVRFTLKPEQPGAH